MTFEYEGGDEPVVGTADPELELYVQDEKAVFALNDNGGVFKNVLTNPHNVAPIVWTSSDETVATVDQEGTATFKGVGTTIISAAFAGDDTYKAQTVSYTLQIKAPVRVEPDLSFDEAEYSYTFGNGKFESPKVNNPKALTGLKWSSSDESVATVKWNGEVVPVKGGTVDEPAEIYPVEIIIIPGIGDKFNPDTSYAIYSKVKYDATTTGVAAMEIATGKAEYYNLQGVRVANPEKGAYVKVQNGKAAKVML